MYVCVCVYILMLPPHRDPQKYTSRSFCAAGKALSALLHVDSFCCWQDWKHQVVSVVGVAACISLLMAVFKDSSVSWSWPVVRGAAGENQEEEEQLVKHRGGNSAGCDWVCVDLCFFSDLKWIFYFNFLDFRDICMEHALLQSSPAYMHKPTMFGFENRRWSLFS